MTSRSSVRCRSVAFVVWFAWMSVVLGACAPDDSPRPMACIPGTTSACTCLGGGSGVQACNESGTGFGVCVCTGPMPDGGLDMGRPMVCTPGSTMTCSCPRGSAATTTCLPDGSGFAPCDCRPTCGPDTCEGCCDGSTCRPGNTSSACGAGGAACTSCGADFTCSTTSRQCELGTTTRWGVTVTYVQVPTTTYGGSAWDAFGGAPDIQVCVTVGEGTSAARGCTAEASDTFTATFSGGPTLRGSPRQIAERLSICVYDVDVSSDDLVGCCYTTFDPTRPLPTDERRFDCARDATSFTAGFSARIRLAPSP